MDQPPNILAERIQTRLDALGWSARMASMKAGLGPDAIRTIRGGGMPNARRLQALAAALGCDVRYLLGEIDTLEQASPERQLYHARTPISLQVERVIATDVWTPQNNPPSATGWYVEVLPEHETSLLQWLEVVRGPSANMVVPDGGVVHLVETDSTNLISGSIVVVERLRYGRFWKDTLAERSLRRVRERLDGRQELVGLSFDDRYNYPIPVAQSPTEERDELIAVRGLAVRAHLMLRQPSE